ncbi:hypothetical protein [Shivajiella indica]|uniref:Outer membrane protein beta-barrel domain-containing protein n=1 Tax=Shivajiella indica TaxID=872115 RepID=A0ABW5BBN3_9BACT
MRNFIFAFIISLFFIEHGYAQEKAFINHTDFGLSFGRVQIWDGNYNTRVNISFSSFNGVRINPNHAVGFVVGIDTYPNLTLMPLAFAWRGFLEKGKRTSPFAGFDLGYSSAWMENRTSNDFSEQWYEGGLMASPTIGIKRNSKKGNYAFTWSLGYKRQNATYFDGIKELQIASSLNSNDLPPGFSSVREEAYIFNSLFFKWGLIF